jgi:hypothetical protein
MKDVKMEHVRNRKWDNINRLESINKIVKKLQETGSTDVKYYRGRSFTLSQIMGKGHLEPMPEEGEWNQVIIQYDGRVALKLFEGNRKIEGILFNEKFNESEYIKIKNAMASSGIYTFQDELHNNKIASFLCIFLIISSFIAAIWGIYMHDIMWTLVYSFVAFGFFFIYSYK